MRSILDLISQLLSDVIHVVNYKQAHAENKEGIWSYFEPNFMEIWSRPHEENFLMLKHLWKNERYK
jgi:hypothetical protein